MLGTIIFDFYGVLVKPASMTRALHNLLKEKGIEKEYAEVRANYAKYSLGLWNREKFLASLGINKKIERKLLEKIKFEKGAKGLLKKLSKNYTLFLLSNAPSYWASYTNKKFSLTKYFNKIFISAELKMKKPNMKLYRYVDSFEKGKKLFIEDKYENLAPVKKLNWLTCWIKNKVYPKIDEVDFIINNILQVEEVIKKCDLL